MSGREHDPYDEQWGVERARSLEYATLRALLRDLEEPIVRAAILKDDYDQGYDQGVDDARRSAAAALYMAMREDGLVD